MKDGKYNSVNHWTGYTNNKQYLQKHYATTNHIEYFAETVEAFFSSNIFRNDMFPFYRSELKDFDRDGFDMVAKVFEIDDPEAYFSSKRRNLSGEEEFGYNNMI